MSRGFDIASSSLLNVAFLRGLALTAPNILLVDHSESAGLQQGNPEFGRAPAGQLLNPVETAGVS